jgi:ABC-type nitrate/sulfonate/bicarbonate transport system substrate-binding protein
MDDLTLWYTTCPGPSAVALAGELGRLAEAFAPDGVTVRTLASAPAERRVVRRAHQLVPDPERFALLMRHGGNPPVLAALSRGDDVRIVGLTWTEATRRVLTLGDSPVHTPADLAGRRLAVPRRHGVAVDYVRSVTLRTYAEALRSGGLTFDDVTLVDVDGGAWGRTDDGKADRPHTEGIGGAWSTAATHRSEAIALVRGEVDVIAGEHAQAVSIQAALSLRTVFDTALSTAREARASGDQPLVLTAAGALLDDHPDLVARFVAQTLDAADWAAEHDGEARRRIAGDVGLPEELLDAAYSPDVTSQLGLDLDPRTLDALQVQHDHLLAHGFLARGVDVAGSIDPAPLAAARDLRRHHAIPAAATTP